MTPPGPRRRTQALIDENRRLLAERERLQGEIAAIDRANLELTVPEPLPRPARGDWGCSVFAVALAALGAVFVWWRL